MNTKQLEAEGTLNFSHSIQQNLSIIHEELKESFKKLTINELEPSSSSECFENVQLNQQQKRLQQASQELENLLISWQKNSTKFILIYNRLIHNPVRISDHSHFVFQHTLFHPNIWPLLTHFLEIKLNYSTLTKTNSRVIDVWYQFISCEEKSIFEQALNSNLFENQNLGEWFRKECIENLFLNFHSNNKKSYTNFIVKLLLQGLPFLFFSSVSILHHLLNKEKNSPKYPNKFENQTQLKIIQTNYIDRFHLNRMK